MFYAHFIHEIKSSYTVYIRGFTTVGINIWWVSIHLCKKLESMKGLGYEIKWICIVTRLCEKRIVFEPQNGFTYIAWLKQFSSFDIWVWIRNTISSWSLHKQTVEAFSIAFFFLFLPKSWIERYRFFIGALAILISYRKNLGLDFHRNLRLKASQRINKFYSGCQVLT